MISEISEAHWATQLSCDYLMGKLCWLGRGRKQVAWTGWWLMGGRWKDLTPGPALPPPVLILLWFTPRPSSFRPGWLPPPLSRLPVYCLWKQRRFKWRQSDQARGQPPLQHHAPCLLVNCSENWICLLALNCLEETLCKGQNWMDRFLCFITWIINYKLSTSLITQWSRNT